MGRIRQIRAITAIGLKSIPQRLWSSLVIVLGVGTVVAVLISAITLAESLTGTIASSGREDRAVVLRDGADSESTSTLVRETVAVVGTAAGIKTGSDGRALASPEVVTGGTVASKQDHSVAEVTVRGITPIGFDVRPEINVLSGRRFEAGLREVMVGRAAESQFAGLALGDEVAIRGTKWKVVGTFSSDASTLESELLVDAESLLSAIQSNVFQSVTVQLDSPASLASLQAALEADPRLFARASSEKAYFEQQSRKLGLLLFIAAYAVGGIMALGATLGVLTTMYSSVGVRGPEIATFRAMGFGGTSVLVSILTEALTLAVAGALLGVLVTWLVFDGDTINTLYDGGQVVTTLEVRGSYAGVALAWALIICLGGGLFPSLNAARRPVAAALRAS
jgi:putative ABC transport system permease protein